MDNTTPPTLPTPSPITETPKIEVPVKAEIKYKPEKCSRCNKDGWIKCDGFQDGEKKKRLIMRCMFEGKPKSNIVCNECLDKET